VSTLWLLGEHRGEMVRHPLRDGEMRVGRGSTNELVLPSQTVSRHHATLPCPTPST
jgi:pSer/pThr/pTyr-binding forkhead associated (FHA) protein